MPARIKHGNCALCRRETALTFHHLIPRKLHGRNRFANTYTRAQLNEGLMLCRKCHKGLHRLYDEMELGSRLSTEQALRNDPKIAKHVRWVAKQRTS